MQLHGNIILNNLEKKECEATYRLANQTHKEKDIDDNKEEVFRNKLDRRYSLATMYMHLSRSPFSQTYIEEDIIDAKKYS